MSKISFFKFLLFSNSFKNSLKLLTKVRLFFLTSTLPFTIPRYKTLSLNNTPPTFNNFSRKGKYLTYCPFGPSKNIKSNSSFNVGKNSLASPVKILTLFPKFTSSKFFLAINAEFSSFQL